METKKEIKYPYLPEGVSIEYVGEENVFMKQAKENARRSKDQSFPTGAVIVINNKVISEACNKPPLTNERLIKWHKNGLCFRRILGIPSGQKYWLCPGCAKSSAHAEYRAVLEIQKKNLKDLNNSTLYLWGHWWCCKPCWGKMLEVGIKKVFLLKDSEILFDINNPKNIMGRQFESQ